MPQISDKNKEKVSEQILGYLFSTSPEAIFTSKIASELARDEEFTLTLLKSLEKKKLVVKVTKNSQGEDFSRRKRWRLSNATFEAYKRMQNNNSYKLR